MTSSPQKPLFIRACLGEQVERTPIWIMRQAGRYLPAYRATREKVDFQTLYRTPSLAAEVTVQPIEILGFDAAIIFSDILVVPEAMGMELEFNEGSGPRFPKPLRNSEEVRDLKIKGAAQRLDYVYEAIRQTKARLAGVAPLIGFCGSPWTLATYMIEGHGSKSFIEVKTLLYRQPDLLHELLGSLTEVLKDYLNLQLEAGADAVQIFDSWGHVLAPDAYEAFSRQYIARLIKGVNRSGKPIIYFNRGRGSGIDRMAVTGAQVLGLDWTIDLEEARVESKDAVALQGNLDPCILFATPEVIRREAHSILKKMRGSAGHIFNLGHGILPETPVESVKALIEAVREFRM